MKHNIRLFFSLVILAFTSCSKDLLNDAPPAMAQHPGNMTFTILHRIVNDTVVEPIDTSAAAIFWDDKGETLTVEYVKLNGAWMAYHKYLGHYLQHDLNHVTNFFDIHWDISRDPKNPVPSDYYVNSKGMPRYNDHRLLPDSVDRSKDIQFVFSGLSNMENIFLELNDRRGNHIEKSLSEVKNSGTITITSSELSTLGALSDGYVAFNISNVSVQPIGASFFTYVNNMSYLKDLRIH